MKGKDKNNIDSLTQKYRNKVKIKTNGEFDLVSPYNDKVVSVYHSECDRVSELNPRYFLSRLVCSHCAKEKRYDLRKEKTKEIINDFKQELKELVGDEYVVTKDWMDPDERKVSIKHNCGHEYKIKINSFRSGRRCPICTKTQPKPPEEYEREFYDVVEDRFQLLAPYERAIKKIPVLCNRCHKKSLVNPSGFLRDSRCPKCEKKSNRKINKAIDSIDK